jgi:hypothetical protein
MSRNLNYSDDFTICEQKSHLVTTLSSVNRHLNYSIVTTLPCCEQKSHLGTTLSSVMIRHLDYCIVTTLPCCEQKSQLYSQ